MNNLTDLLSYISPASLDYQEWVNVGMALKHEGYSYDVWDSWSMADSRYKAGECERKWNTFNENTSSIVTGGTIYDMAVKNGFTPKEVVTFDWDDEIEYDGDPETIIRDTAWVSISTIEKPKDKPTDQFRRYLQTLYKPDDIVGFCIDSEYDTEQKKYKPSSKGSYGLTAEYLLGQIKKYPDDIKAVIGDYDENAGVWIRFNPLDGKGVNDVNVTDLRYALVESDSIEVEKQKAIMEELKLPIVMMVHSGGKSIHAIVKINAITKADYQEKVDYLYRVCEKNGLIIDKNNKNPSRLSRMPGIKRGNKMQFIIAQNIGLSSFDEWKDYIENLTDTLPEIVTPDLDNLPDLLPEIICGILRQGHKMLISGASKAGKSFLLIELAFAVQNGKKWLGYQCEKGKVLYINLEVDGNSFQHRMAAVRNSHAKDETQIKAFELWNLRGAQTEIKKLAPRLIRRTKDKNYSMIIIDPLYKLNEGDENSASEMGKFFNQLDHICKEVGASIVLCHHHSKGAQANKFSIDRASGSGVFARDPDALLDLIQLNPKDADISLERGATAWRMSFVLREFETPEDIDIIFKYPTHTITQNLKEANPLYGMDSSTNSQRGNKVKKENATKNYDRLCYFIENWDEIDKGSLAHTQHPSIQDAVKYFSQDKGFSEKNIRRMIQKYDDYIIKNKIIYENTEEE